MKKPTLKTILTTEEQSELLAYYDYVDKMISDHTLISDTNTNLIAENEKLKVTNRSYFERITSSKDEEEDEEEAILSCSDIAGSLLKEKIGGK